MRASQIIVLSVSAIVGGCAADTGVVPLGEGGYMIAKQQATGFPGLGHLKADALREAAAFCGQKSKDFKVTRVMETSGPYVLGHYPRAEINFVCE